MDNQHYKNREIDDKFDKLHEKLDLILAQTTKTNGRVTKLEGDLGSLKLRLYIIGAVGTTVVAFKFPDIMNAVKTFI